MSIEHRQLIQNAEHRHHASYALFTITRLLRRNLDDVDLPGGCAISVCEQHGLLLAAEHIAQSLYSYMEQQHMDVENEVELERA